MCSAYTLRANENDSSSVALSDSNSRKTSASSTDANEPPSRRASDATSIDLRHLLAKRRLDEYRAVSSGDDEPVTPARVGGGKKTQTGPLIVVHSDKDMQRQREQRFVDDKIIYKITL